jgi:hypothetical protein
VAVQVAPARAPPTRNTAAAASEKFAGAVVTVPEVQLKAIGTDAGSFGTKSLLTVIVAGALHPAKVIGTGSVNVTLVVAMARPVQFVLVMVTAAPERRVPLKVESVSVAAAEVFQNTLHDSAEPPMFTVAPVSVRAPGPPVPTLKIQTSLAFPLSVRVTPAGIVVPAAEQ